MSATRPSEHCPICDGAIPRRLSDWNHYCARCDYWSADLPYDIGSETDAIFTDGGGTGEVIGYLDAVRVASFSRLLERIETLRGRTLEILDVGCATGLFLRMAAQRGHRVTGLEPNPRMSASARRSGLEVIEGFFPASIPLGRAFDVIIFNDVFEHIPALDGILEGVKAHLVPGGLLVINLPSSRGFLFRLGQGLYRLGITSLWDRLWQKMFYTPHLHYFNPASLDRLVSRRGMVPCARPMELSTVALRGLWARVAADRKAPLPRKVITYLGALGVWPLLRLLPRDSFAAFYEAGLRHRT